MHVSSESEVSGSDIIKDSQHLDELSLDEQMAETGNLHDCKGTLKENNESTEGTIEGFLNKFKRTFFRIMEYFNYTATEHEIKKEENGDSDLSDTTEEESESDDDSDEETDDETETESDSDEQHNQPAKSEPSKDKAYESDSMSEIESNGKPYLALNDDHLNSGKMTSSIVCSENIELKLNRELDRELESTYEIVN